MAPKTASCFTALSSARAAVPKVWAPRRWNSTLFERFSLNASQAPKRVQSEFKNRQWNQEKMQDERARNLERNNTRNWKVGDVYSPHDLSPSEMKKWRKRKSPSTDAFDALGINPLHQYKNFAIMSEYVTDMGRIRHRSETGLRPVNQRKVAKAIRRAIGLGLMPSVYKHPEILIDNMARQG